jgi:hypothetical protein
MIGKPTLVLVVGALAALAVPGISQASEVYTINQTNTFSGGTAPDCSGVGGCGTVTVTDNGSGVYTFTVDLTSALVLHSGKTTLGFNLTGVTAVGPSGTATETTPGQMDGFGTFAFGADCAVLGTGSFCATNGQSPSHEFVFTVDATSGQTDFGIALDVGNSACPSGTGCGTGFADTVLSGTVPNVPLPAALPLFATGLSGLGLLGWRRKRKAQAFA